MRTIESSLTTAIARPGTFQSCIDFATYWSKPANDGLAAGFCARAGAAQASAAAAYAVRTIERRGFIWGYLGEGVERSAANIASGVLPRKLDQLSRFLLDRPLAPPRLGKLPSDAP